MSTVASTEKRQDDPKRWEDPHNNDRIPTKERDDRWVCRWSTANSVLRYPPLICREKAVQVLKDAGVTPAITEADFNEQTAEDLDEQALAEANKKLKALVQDHKQVNDDVLLQYHFWQAKGDGSAKPVDVVERQFSKSYEFHSVEVTTPVLYGDPWTLKQRELIRAPLHALRLHMRLHVSTECGLHVHVGNSGKEMDIGWRRRIALLWMFALEPIAYRLVGPWRFSGHNGSGTNMYCKPLSDCRAAQHEDLGQDYVEFYSAAGRPTPSDLIALFGSLERFGLLNEKDQATARVIWDKDDEGLAVALMDSDRWDRLTVHFTRGDDDPGHPVTSTVEFRIFHGTIDPEVASAFAALAYRCTDFARVASDWRWGELFFPLVLHSQMGDWDRAADILLRELGLGETAQTIWGQIQQNYANQQQVSWVIEHLFEPKP